MKESCDTIMSMTQSVMQPLVPPTPIPQDTHETPSRTVPIEHVEPSIESPQLDSPSKSEPPKPSMEQILNEVANLAGQVA